MPDKFKEYIKIDPNIKGGTPVIKGTRVSVAEILSLFEEENFIQAVINNLKEEDVSVTKEAVFTALEYAKYTSLHAPKKGSKAK